jgi:hypothetical protein
VQERITYVGLDVHKDGIVVAVAEGGIGGEVRELWSYRERSGDLAWCASSAVKG